MKLVILDRDGVINEDSDNYIKSPEEWNPIPGSPEAIAKLYRSGFTVAVATNQSGIGRGYFDISVLNAMHEKMHKIVNLAGGHIAGVFFCPHTPSDNCSCRKPRAGLLHQISDRFAINLEKVPFIGDTISDLECAQSVAATPVLVRTGKGKITESKLEADHTIAVFDNLSTAVDYLIENE